MFVLLLQGLCSLVPPDVLSTVDPVRTECVTYIMLALYQDVSTSSHMIESDIIRLCLLSWCQAFGILYHGFLTRGFNRYLHHCFAISMVDLARSRPLMPIGQAVSPDKTVPSNSKQSKISICLVSIY